MAHTPLAGMDPNVNDSQCKFCPDGIDTICSSEFAGSETDSLLRLETLSQRCTMLCLEEDVSDDTRYQRCFRALKAPPNQNTKRLKKLPICFPLHQTALLGAVNVPNTVEIEKATMEVKREVLYKVHPGTGRRFTSAALEKLVSQRAWHYAQQRSAQ